VYVKGNLTVKQQMLNGKLWEGFREWQLPRVKMLSRSCLGIASIIAFTLYNQNRLVDA
jgi:hypothetical protein